MRAFNKIIPTVNNPRSKKALQNIVGSFAVKGISIVLSLIIVPLTLSYLTQYEYGVWLTISSLLLWLDFFDIGLTNGLRNKLTECVARQEWEKGKAYVSTTLALMSVIALINILLFALINRYLDWNSILNIEEPISNINLTVFIVFALCMVNFVMKTIGTIFTANQEPVFTGVFGCISQAFSILLIYILTKTTNGSLMYVAICFTLSPILVYFISYPFAFKKRYPNIAPSIKNIDLSLTRDIVGVGVQFFFIQIANLILFQSSNILISRIFNPAEVTPYNIGYRYLNIVLMLFTIALTPLWSAITDAFTKKDFNWISRSVSSMLKLWVVFVLLVIVMFVLSEIAIKIWVGDRVIVSKQILIPIGLFVIIDMWNRIFSSFANGTSHLSIQLYTAIIEGITYIPLAVLLSKHIGVAGIAWALFIVSLLPSVLLYIDYRRTMFACKKQ